MKTRIIKHSHGDHVEYEVQEKILFWWRCACQGYDNDIYFDTLEEARKVEKSMHDPYCQEIVRNEMI